MLGQSPGDRDWETETALLKQTVLLTQAQAVQTCRQVSRGGTNLQKEHAQTLGETTNQLQREQFSGCGHFCDACGPDTTHKNTRIYQWGDWGEQQAVLNPGGLGTLSY